MVCTQFQSPRAALHATAARQPLACLAVVVAGWASGLAQAQTLTEAAAPATKPAAVLASTQPSRASTAPAPPAKPPAAPAQEAAAHRTVVEDDQVRIEELKVRGQVLRITVQSKLRSVAPYQILPPSAARDPSVPGQAAGQRVWSFDF